MMPYIFIAVVIVLCAVTFRLAYRDLERTREARRFIRLCNLRPRTTYVEIQRRDYINTTIGLR